MPTTKFILTDESLMYMGTHKGEKLANLPEDYCRWLLKQSWIKSHEALYAYLIDNEGGYGNELDNFTGFEFLND